MIFGECQEITPMIPDVLALVGRDPNLSLEGCASGGLIGS